MTEAFSCPVGQKNSSCRGAPALTPHVPKWKLLLAPSEGCLSPHKCIYASCLLRVRRLFSSNLLCCIDFFLALLMGNHVCNPAVVSLLLLMQLKNSGTVTMCSRKLCILLRCSKQRVCRLSKVALCSFALKLPF